MTLANRTPLRIFVAKSFRDPDQPRIQPIERFLASFAKVGIEVQTGEPSEPESISQKVRERIDNATVFVGIFTRRFPIYGRAGVKTLLNILRGRTSAWNAPPWVLQECGYAVAKGHKLVLFLEPQVDIGGLQGDLEFIPYDYRNPAEALTKTSWMLNKIIADHYGTVIHTSIETGTALQVPPPAQLITPISGIEAPEAEPTEPADPDPLKSVFISLFTAAKDKDFATAEREFEAGLRIVGEDHFLSVFDWKKMYFRMLLKGRVSGALDRMRGLAKEFSEEPEVPGIIGDYLRDYNEFDKAALEYKRAAALSEAPEKYEYELLTARCLRSAGKNPDAREVLSQLFTAEDLSAELRSRTMMEMAAIYRASGENFLGFSVAELGLRHDPANASLRFQLGLDYSNDSYFDLNALHFKVLMDHSPDNSASENNFAVACSELSLPITSVRHYKLALSKGETLAANNLGYRFLEAGFQEECEAVLTETASKENCVTEVHQALGVAKGRALEEEAKLAEIIRNADERRDLLARIGDATFSTTPVTLAGVWVLDAFDVSFQINGRELLGSAEKDYVGSLEQLMSFSSLATAAAKTRQTLHLTGEFFGKVCKYVMTVRSSTEGDFFPKTTHTEGFILFSAVLDSAEIVQLKEGRIDIVKSMTRKG
jgi:tetratricopeptide (TPR) repeat protein